MLHIKYSRGERGKFISSSLSFLRIYIFFIVVEFLFCSFVNEKNIFQAHHFHYNMNLERSTMAQDLFIFLLELVSVWRGLYNYLKDPGNDDDDVV